MDNNYPFYFKEKIKEFDNATLYGYITKNKCVSILEHINDAENKRNYDIEIEILKSIEEPLVKIMIENGYKSTKEEFEQARTKLLDFIMDNAF